jgi:hypothetical protein
VATPQVIMLVVYSVLSATKQKMQLIVLGDNEHIFKILLPRIFSNNQRKLVSPIEQGEKMIV